MLQDPVGPGWREEAPWNKPGRTWLTEQAGLRRAEGARACSDERRGERCDVLGGRRARKGGRRERWAGEVVGGGSENGATCGRTMRDEGRRGIQGRLARKWLGRGGGGLQRARGHHWAVNRHRGWRRKCGGSSSVQSAGLALESRLRHVPAQQAFPTLPSLLRSANTGGAASCGRQVRSPGSPATVAEDTGLPSQALPSPQP